MFASFQLPGHPLAFYESAHTNSPLCCPRRFVLHPTLQTPPPSDWTARSCDDPAIDGFDGEELHQHNPSSLPPMMGAASDLAVPRHRRSNDTATDGFHGEELRQHHLQPSSTAIPLYHLEICVDASHAQVNDTIALTSFPSSPDAPGGESKSPGSAFK